MRNEAKRAALHKAAADELASLSTYLTDAKPDVREVFQPAINGLKDIQDTWLATRLAVASNEDWWLNITEMQLQSAVTLTRTLRQQIDRFGGPTKAAIIGH